MKSTEKFARKCDITNEGMNEGYCILDGLMYIKHDMDMLQHITDETDYDSIEDAYEDDYYYHTEWEEIADDSWFSKDGVEMYKCLDCKTIIHNGSFCKTCKTPEESHWEDVATYNERFSGDDY